MEPKRDWLPFWTIVTASLFADVVRRFLGEFLPALVSFLLGSALMIALVIWLRGLPRSQGVRTARNAGVMVVALALLQWLLSKMR